MNVVIDPESRQIAAGGHDGPDDGDRDPHSFDDGDSPDNQDSFEAWGSARPVSGEHMRDLVIVNRRGLHARASAKLVKLVDKFDAVIEIAKDGQTVGGTSIMGLMMLAAGPGCSIRVAADGAQAEAAMDAIADLVARGFDETD